MEYLTAFFYRQTIISLVTKRIAPESCCYDIGLQRQNQIQALQVQHAGEKLRNGKFSLPR